ncbi:hypothetical protein [Streptomyces goshikiensis]
MRAGYPNRDKALRQIHRTRGAQYHHALADFKQRYAMGFPVGVQAAVDRMVEQMRLAMLGGGHPQVIVHPSAPSV